MNENEAENSMNLVNARNNGKSSQSVNPVKKATSVALSFKEKLSKHWVILLVAVLCDIVGLIPILSIIVNLGFGLILFLYFGSKKTKNPSANLLGIVLPELLGSVFDWILSVLPVNIGTTLIRIALSDDTE
ncbi:MAG: hypothetical protein WC906_03230 [Parcubacteria group bacterium]|jgi:hypothetical protein